MMRSYSSERPRRKRSPSWMNMLTGIVQTRRRFGEELTADVHEHLVRLHDAYALDLGVGAQLLGHAAVAAAYDQHFADAGVYRHGHVHHHLVVDELVLFGEHHFPVQADEPPEVHGVEDVHLLDVAHAAEQLPRDAYVQLDVGGAEIGKPDLH